MAANGTGVVGGVSCSFLRFKLALREDAAGSFAGVADVMHLCGQVSPSRLRVVDGSGYRASTRTKLRGPNSDVELLYPVAYAAYPFLNAVFAGSAQVLLLRSCYATFVKQWVRTTSA